MGLFTKHEDEMTGAADTIQRMEGEIGRTVVQLRTAPVVRKREFPSEYNSAWWMRSMRYEEMMQMARNMHAVKGLDPIDTPEQLAAWLIRWARLAQESYDETGSTDARQQIQEVANG